MHGRKLTALAIGVATLVAAAPAAASPASDAAVCNEAENSHRGDYVLTNTGDPNPPAFLRGKQMKVGAAAIAAGRSPALALCTSTTPPADDGGDGGDGGGDDDGGPIAG